VAQNPLRFSLPPDVDEDALMQGAESLSRQVLDSGMYRLPSMHQLSNKDRPKPCEAKPRYDQSTAEPDGASAAPHGIYQ
jgi:hypothetical protein